MKLLIALFFLFLAIVGAAQTSVRGYFSVNVTSGCNPLDLEITSTRLKSGSDCTSSQPCLMSFEGEPIITSPQNDFQHTYSKPGVYTLRVQYQSTGEDYIEITVKENLAPVLKLLPCTSSEIKLKMASKASYDYFKIVFDGDESSPQTAANPTAGIIKSFAVPFGSHTADVRGVYANAAENCQVSSLQFTLQDPPPPFIQTLNSQLPDNITFQLNQPAQENYSIEGSIDGDAVFTNLLNHFQGDVYRAKGDIRNNYFCYRIHTSNACTAADIYSNIICTQKFSAEALGDRNKLSWVTSSTGVQNYQVTEAARPMDGNGMVSPPTHFFDDFTAMAAGCKKQSTYRLVVRYANGSTSTSYKLANVNPKLIQALPPVANISTAVSGNSVTVAWALADPSKNSLPDAFTLFRSTRNASYVPISASHPDTPWSYADQYNSGYPVCYQVSYGDGCGNVSPLTAKACVIQPAVAAETNGELRITWNPYTGFSKVAQYRLLKTDENGKTIEEKNVGAETSFLDPNTDKSHSALKYYIFADPDANANVPPAQSEAAVHKNLPVVFFPNAFTPNGDGNNDVFCAQGLYFAKVTFFVYDRWGNVVYATDDNAPWDGTHQGVLLPPEVYAWRAEVRDLEGHAKKYGGTVYMINK